MTTQFKFQTNTPVLETERMKMRHFKSGDFDKMGSFYADPVSKYYGGPCDRQTAFRLFSMYPGHWQLRGYGPWALESKDHGDCLGICGLWYPEGWVEPEITWVLLPEHHGNGYATEAAKRALFSAYEDFGWKTAVSVISVDNEPSAAVARRVGAVVEADVEFILVQQNYIAMHLQRVRFLSRKTELPEPFSVSVTICALILEPAKNREYALVNFYVRRNNRPRPSAPNITAENPSIQRAVLR